MSTNQNDCKTRIASNYAKNYFYRTDSFGRLSKSQKNHLNCTNLTFSNLIAVKLRGTMQPDTYKPIVTVSIMPVEEADSFQYASQNAAILQNDPAFHFAVILSLAYFTLLFN